MTLSLRFFDLSGVDSADSKRRYSNLIHSIRSFLDSGPVSSLIVKTVFLYIPGQAVSKVTLNGREDIFDSKDVNDYLGKGAIILHIDGNIFYSGRRYYFKIGHDMFPGSIYIGVVSLRELSNSDGSLGPKEELSSRMFSFFDNTFGDLIG